MSKDILRGAFYFANRIRTDMQRDMAIAQITFQQGLADLSTLMHPPLPKDILTVFGDQVREKANLESTRFFSFPSINEYLYPRNGFTVKEARRTYTTHPHSNLHDLVVGLHFLNQRGIDEHAGVYYWAVTRHQAGSEPFPLLRSAQFDPDLDPRVVIDYYQKGTPWTRFHPDQVPSHLADQVIQEMKKAELL